MPRIQYKESGGNLGEASGSDARLDVSARSDSREFYISRDDGQLYSFASEDDDAVAGDLVAYLRNDSASKVVFIREIIFSAEKACTFKLHFGNTTAATGTPITPVNLNTTSSNQAVVTAVGNAAVGGVTASTYIGAVRLVANDTFVYERPIMLGQGKNIVIEYDTGDQGDLEVEIVFYLDTTD